MKAITFLMLIVLGAFAVLGYVVKALVTYQEQVKALRVQVQHLEATLSSAQADLEAAEGRMHELEQTLATVQAERDQAMAERDAWQAWAQQVEQALREAQAENERLQVRVQELEQALQVAQTQSAADVEVSALLLPQRGLWSIFAPAFLVILVVVGYSGYQFIRKFEHGLPLAIPRPVTVKSPDNSVRGFDDGGRGAD
jgi:prefoldin subunit 5